MGGKKKKGKAEPDDLWDDKEDGASVEAPVPTAKKGKKARKNKGFADLDDEELEALEAEIVGGDVAGTEKVKGEEKVKGHDEPVRKPDVTEVPKEAAKDDSKDITKESKEASGGASKETSGKGGKKAKKKKKKADAEVDDEELEAVLRDIEGKGTAQPSPPTEAKQPATDKTSQEKSIEKSSPPIDKPPAETSSTNKASSDVPAVSGAGEGAEGDGGAEEEEQSEDKKKKKKKKKKAAEEEKKPAKRPGKGVPVAMIKKLQAAREEEERLRQEEIRRLEREEEEREQKRLEKLRLEQERKERLKQKEREKKQRRKLEGKPVTKKEKEAEARRQAQLAALKEQGITIPDKVEGAEKKKVVYGSRQRAKKNKQQTDPQGDVSAESAEITTPTTEPSPSDKIAESAPAEAEESDRVVDTWEDFDDQEEKEDVKDSWEDEDGAVGEVKPPIKESSESEGTESSEEDTDDESESEEDSELTSFEKAKRRIEARRIQSEASRSEDNLRSPVVCVLGHVDTGKTKILDKIRKTNVQDGEAGGITQQIGATFVPLDSIKEQTKMVKEFTKFSVRLPGLLIIDTPGHESFSNLRTRGSSLCDIAILVVDIMHGLEPQTLESLSILRKGKTPFIVALNKIDRLFDWQRNPNSGVKETLKRQKPNTKNQFDERVKLTVTEFAEQGLNVALFWDKVDFSEYIPLVPTSAITGDGMGDLIALIVTYSQKLLTKQLMLSQEVEAVVMEVKVISGLGTTIDVILRNGELKEGDTIVLTGIDGPFVTTIRALLMPQPLRELRVKNAYLTPSQVCAAQGVKITAKGELDKTVAGTQLYVAHKPDEVDVLKEEASLAMKSALSAIKLQERGVYVQASTLGSLEALLEFLKQSKIPYCGVNIGPVHKRDVMKCSVMLEHDSQWAVILAFDVKVEREAQEMADSFGVKIFSADIIYHLFDAFLKHRQEYRDQKRKEFENVAVFPCKLRVLPNCIFNTRDPIIVGVVVETGVLKAGTPLTVPSKNFTDIGVVSSLELNHKTVDMVRQGAEVCIRVEATGDAPRLYGRHFDHNDLLVSKISRESIDAVKNYFREDMLTSDWQLIIELKKTFGII